MHGHPIVRFAERSLTRFVIFYVIVSKMWSIHTVKCNNIVYLACLVFIVLKGAINLMKALSIEGKV